MPQQLATHHLRVLGELQQVAVNVPPAPARLDDLGRAFQVRGAAMVYCRRPHGIAHV